QASQAFVKCISIFSKLIKEQPREVNYKATLASKHNNSGSFFLHANKDFSLAEKAFRRAAELYAELANNDPQEPLWLVRQAETSCELARALHYLEKQEEALGCCRRALDLLNLSDAASSFDRAEVFLRIGHLALADSEKDDYFHRAIVEYRKFFVVEKR